MYRRYGDRLLGYALRRAPVETAKDAVADTLLAAWRRFDELPEDPLPWLIGTTRKSLANQRRSSERQARLAGRLALEEASQLESGTRDVDDPWVRRALQSLTADDRETLALVAWEGLTPAQAARSLGCSPATFRVRLHRARRRFERALVDDPKGARPDARTRKHAAIDVKEVS